MATNINQIYNNFSYAPGIATYGGNGATGAQGEHGNCIFFTTYNIMSGEDLPELREAIQEQRLPIKNGIKFPRKYQNGDYFFDSTGTIFRLHDIDKLTRFPILADNYQVYFTLCGQIKSNNDANALFATTADTNKISLNQYYAGVDINNTDKAIPNTDTEDYALRIFGDNIQNKSDIVEILHATPFYNFTQNADFKIYYDGINNVWHLDSDVPIVVDSEIKVNNNHNDIIDLDDYSSVIITDTPITSFYNIASKIKYNKPNFKEDDGQWVFISLNLPEDKEFRRFFDEQFLNKIRVKIEYDGKTFITQIKDKYSISLKLDNNKNSNKTILISLIYNIEVFINET